MASRCVAEKLIVGFLETETGSRHKLSPSGSIPVPPCGETWVKAFPQTQF